MNRVVSLVSAMVVTSSALAIIPEGDVSPFANGGRVGTNLVSEDGLTTTANVRVFFAELGEDVPNFTQEPGWQSPDGTFAGDGLLTFQINRALRRWNGSDFSQLGGAIELAFGPLTPISTPASDMIVPGFDLPIDSEGGLHDHPDYTLAAPALDGIYLLDISFAVPSQGLAMSEPVWILFGQNAQEADAQAAYDWATANVPAPGLLGVALVAGLGAARRRR